MKRRVATCFVAVDNATGELAGYYTLSPTSLLLGNLPQDLSKKLPKYPQIGAYLIGRLARGVQFKGLGSALLADALFKVLALPGVFATVVDAKDDAAVRFYERNGFMRLPPDRDRKLFIPMDTVARLKH